MANIATTANESVARGVENSGQAQIIQGQPQDPLGRYYRAKNAEQPDPKLVAQAKRKRDEDFAKLMDTDFDMGWQIHDSEIQMDIDAYRNNIAGYQKRGGDFTDPDFQRVAAEEKDKIKLKARRSEAMKEANKEVYETIKGDDEYDFATANTDLLNQRRDENGDPLSAFNMSEDRFNSVLDNANNFDMNKVWRNAIDNFEEISHKAYKMKWKQTGSDKEVTEWSGRLLDPNTPGQVNFGQEQRDVLYAYDKVKKYVDQARESGMNEDEIWSVPLRMLQEEIGIKQDYTTKIYPEWMSGNGKVTIEETPNPGTLLRNINVAWGEKEGQQQTKQIQNPVYNEWTISGEKIDRTINIQGSKVYDMRTGQIFDSASGNNEFIATTIVAVPWSKKAIHERGKETPDNFGYLRVGNTEQLLKQQIDDDNVGVKYFVQGTYTDADYEQREVLIPYEDVQGMVQRKTGFNLADRPISQYKREELIDLARNFKNLKGQELRDAIDRIEAAISQYGDQLTPENIQQIVNQ